MIYIVIIKINYISGFIIKWNRLNYTFSNIKSEKAESALNEAYKIMKVVKPPKTPKNSLLGFLEHDNWNKDPKLIDDNSLVLFANWKGVYYEGMAYWRKRTKQWIEDGMVTGFINDKNKGKPFINVISGNAARLNISDKE